MCNLYTYKLSRDDIRGLMEHYKLVGVEWAEVFEKEMLGKNDEALVYPKYQAPVVIVRDGECVLDHMGWGHAGAAASTWSGREAEAPALPDQRAQHPERPLAVLARSCQRDCRQ
jgi:hypothetical protein